MSFDELCRRVDDGRLRIVFVLGLARGGTTALEKFLYENLPFDSQINEPSLLGPPTDESRAEATFRRVLEHVRRLEDSRRPKYTILIKEVTNKVLPSMIPLWAKLSSTWLVVVRNPLLQMESRLKSMLDRIDSGALLEYGINADFAGLSMVVHDQLMFETPDEPSREELNSSWRRMWSKCKNDRDFSRLNIGALRACTLHPFCAWHECQEVMWGAQQQLPLTQFEDLSYEICDKILEWRLGWSPLRRQLELLDVERLVVDFSSFQMEGGAPVMDWLVDRLFVNNETIPVRMSFEACANTADWTSKSWDQWYGSPCFAKAAKSHGLDPVSKKPMALSKFPKFLQSHLADALRQWASLVNYAPPFAIRAPYAGLDPVHDVVCAAAAAFVFKRPALKRALATLEPQEPAKTWLLDVGAACLVALAQGIMLWQCALAYFWELRIRVVAMPCIVLKRGEYPIDEAALLSVIIPAHNEATTVKSTVDAVLERATTKQFEVVVVDAGSTDGTRDVLNDYGDKIRVVDHVDGGGRGPALNAGAKEAKGHLLFFVHADTLVPENFEALLRDELNDPRCELAAFGLETTLARESLVTRIVEAAANWRASRLQLPWGDHGLALTRTRFDHLGGFKNVPIFEDLDLVLKARRFAAYTNRRVRIMDAKVTTSARRYHDLLSSVKATFLNAVLVIWWHLGATPSQCFKLYYGKTIGGRVPDNPGVPSRDKDPADDGTQDPAAAEEVPAPAASNDAPAPAAANDAPAASNEAPAPAASSEAPAAAAASSEAPTPAPAAANETLAPAPVGDEVPAPAPAFVPQYGPYEHQEGKTVSFHDAIMEQTALDRANYGTHPPSSSS